jgi:hypothetical protein
LAQSIAREYGPKGVHVAHAVIDGVITGPRTEAYSGVNGGAPDGKISADSVSSAFTGRFGEVRAPFANLFCERLPRRTGACILSIARDSPGRLMSDPMSRSGECSRMVQVVDLYS